MTQTFNKSNMRLTQDGHVNLYSKDGRKMLFTTDQSHTKIQHLDRSKFVRPVDVFKIAREYFEHKNVDHEAPMYFISGYNANKNEFTREQVLEAMCYASSYLSSEKGIQSYLDGLQTLSLPEQITIQNNQIIDVKWL